MFYSARPASIARPGRAALPRYQVTGVLVLTLALLLGWGLLGGNQTGWSAFPVMARAASSALNYPLYTWGLNNLGELGNGSNTNSATPVVVSLRAGVTPTAIAAGNAHSLAIGSDSKLYAWGYNYYGQLGNGSNTNSATPVVVSLPAGVTPGATAAGYAHSLAIGRNGKLYAWGLNGFGQLGNGMITNSATPVVVGLPVGVTPTAIAAGDFHSLAIGSDSKLYAWGYNYYGQLGNGSTAFSSSTPVVVSLPAGVTPTAIAAGYNHSLAIGSDGKLYAWGRNQFGQLGNGTTNDSATPMVVSLPAGVMPTAIAAGWSHSLAIGRNGNLYAWGYNIYGQLGNGTINQSSTPVVVGLPVGVTPTAIAAGYGHSLAIESDGKLYAWGNNGYGQLGNGTASGGNPNPTPLLIGSVAGVANPLLAAGYYHTLAVLARPSQIAATGGNNQSATVGTAFATPLVATVRDVANNPVSSTTVVFTAPTSGASGTFAGGSRVYTATADASGAVTATTFIANTIAGSYTVTATVSGVITPATFTLTNVVGCNPLNVTSTRDDGSCGTLRYAVLSIPPALTSKAKIITLDLPAGSVISVTTGLTLTSGVSITTTAPCGIGAGNTMLPPVTIQGTGASSGNGLTLAGNNRLYGLWVRGFSGVQIKAPPGSSTHMQCVKASKL